MEPMLSGEAPGAGARFGARFIDGLVLLIPTLVITVPISGGFAIGSSNTDGAQIVASLLGVLLSYAYFVWMETNRGATVGKGALNIEVYGASGNPTIEQSAKRNAWMLLGIIPGGLGGFLTLVAAIAIGISISRDPDGRGIHDKFADLGLRRER